MRTSTARSSRSASRGVPPCPNTIIYVGFCGCGGLLYILWHLTAFSSTGLLPSDIRYLTANLTYLIGLTCGINFNPDFMHISVRFVAAISLAIPYVSGVVTRCARQTARGRWRGTATPLSVMKRKGVFMRELPHSHNQHVETITGAGLGFQVSNNLTVEIVTPTVRN